MFVAYVCHATVAPASTGRGVVSAAIRAAEAGMGMWREKQVLWYPPVQSSPLRAHPEWLHNELEGAREAASKRLSEAEQLENTGAVEDLPEAEQLENTWTVEELPEAEQLENNWTVEESRRRATLCDPTYDPTMRSLGKSSTSAEIARRLVEARSLRWSAGLGGLKALRDSMGRRVEGLRSSGGSGTSPHSRRGPAQVLPPQPARYAALRHAFNKTDLNNSGDICQREMRSAIQSLQSRGSRRGADVSAKQFIVDADDDGDGRISYPEFRQLVSQAACADLAAKLTLISTDEKDVLACLMDGTEAVLAAEHVLLYKYRLGELQLMASRTQETRVNTRPKLHVGEILDPVVYEKWLRTGSAAILEASRTDVTHIGGKVASVLVVPIHAPGGRALGVLEFVNKAEAFDQAEKDAAVKIAAHLRRAFVQMSLWGAASCPLRGVHQLDRVVKLTLDSKEEDFDFVGIGDALVDTCDVLQSEHPGSHLYVLFLANIVDGERWDDRSKTNDSRVAAALAPHEDVLVVEVSIREADWRAEGQPFPLSHHPRWMLTHLPALVHYRQEREKLQELKLRKPNVFALEDFIRLTLAGDEYDGEARSSRASEWRTPPPVKLDERSSRAEQHASLRFQLETHHASAEQLESHKARLGQDIASLQQLIGSIDPGSPQTSPRSGGRRLSSAQKRATFTLPDAVAPAESGELDEALSLVHEHEESSSRSGTQSARAAEGTAFSSSNNSNSSRPQSASVMAMVATPSAELRHPMVDKRCRSVVTLPECGQTEPGDPDRRASCPPQARRASKEVLENKEVAPAGTGAQAFTQSQARTQRSGRRRSSVMQLVTMAGERMADSLASWEETSQNRIERGLNPLALPSDEMLYEQQLDLRRSFDRDTHACQ